MPTELPYANGITVLKEAQRLFPNAYRILATGTIDIQEDNSVVQITLLKPISLDRLDQILSQIRDHSKP